MAEQRDQRDATSGDGDDDAAATAAAAAAAEDMPRNPLADLRLRRPPFWMIAGFLIFVVVSWLPLVVAARRRVSVSESPQLHIFQDMDNQPRYRGQQANPVFADGRTVRPAIAGTVARGELHVDDHLYRGFTRGADGKVQFLKGFPDDVKVDEPLLRRGQLTFNIYCAPCHGNDGAGQGPVHQRAVALQEAKWVPPANLHDAPIKAREDGHLYNTVTNGIRNMAGYGSQITSVSDRWAVVAYVRALQLSQDAPADVVPPEKLSSVK
jgi:mono/diheme cytochrome c family protein